MEQFIVRGLWPISREEKPDVLEEIRELSLESRVFTTELEWHLPSGCLDKTRFIRQTTDNIGTTSVLIEESYQITEGIRVLIQTNKRQICSEMRESLIVVGRLQSRDNAVVYLETTRSFYRWNSANQEVRVAILSLQTIKWDAAHARNENADQFFLEIEIKTSSELLIPGGRQLVAETAQKLLADHKQCSELTLAQIAEDLLSKKCV